MPRSTAWMQAAPRCGARTRAGTACRSPAVRGRHRCRMHGGAAGSGAPRGNRNAFRHGLYGREAIARRRYVARLLHAGRRLLADLAGGALASPVSRNGTVTESMNSTPGRDACGRSRSSPGKAGRSPARSISRA